MDCFTRVRDARLRDLCAYWLRLRGERLMPSRAEIDPTQVPTVLTYTWIYDYVPPNRFRCRLIGEEVKRLYSPSPRGRFIDEIFPAAHIVEVTNRFLRVVEKRQAAYTFGGCTVSDGQEIFGERIALPLSSDGTTVDSLIGATIYNLKVNLSQSEFVTFDADATYIDISRRSPVA